MVALPGQLFYSTPIPACLWFLARRKNPAGLRDRRGEVLFVDARKLGTLVDRTRRESSDDDVVRIADAYHRWRGEKDAGAYADVPGFCKAAALARDVVHPSRPSLRDFGGFSTRNRLPPTSGSCTKSSDQRWFGRATTGGGARAPTARRLDLRLRTLNPSPA
jgi:hypothetical protein